MLVFISGEFPKNLASLSRLFAASANHRCMGDSPSDETNSPVIRVYDELGNVIETHKHAGDFKEW
jgi:hypothetical protein